MNAYYNVAVRDYVIDLLHQDGELVGLIEMHPERVITYTFRTSRSPPPSKDVDTVAPCFHTLRKLRARRDSRKCVFPGTRDSPVACAYMNVSAIG